MAVRERNSSGLRRRGGVTRSPRTLFKFPQTSNGFLAKGCGFASDGRLASLLHSRHPTVERCDQLLKLTNQVALRYRHDEGPEDRPARRDAFHTSPQRSQRQ